MKHCQLIDPNMTSDMSVNHESSFCPKPQKMLVVSLQRRALLPATLRPPHHLATIYFQQYSLDEKEKSFHLGSRMMASVPQQ